MTFDIASRAHLRTVTQGGYYVSRVPEEILATVLGSCVAVCLYDPKARIGGMNYFLLPFGPDQGGEKPLRYGVHAMELLVNGLLKAGGTRADLQAKLFGAARISPRLRDIGQSNAEFATSFLEAERIPCVGQSLGGNAARRVMFRPTTGEVKVLQVPRSDFNLDSERPAGLPERTDAGDAALF